MLYKFILCLAITISLILLANAMPEFAAREKKQCGYCHYRSSGGGARNYRGIYYITHNRSFKDFVDLGDKNGALKEIWRETMPKGTVSFDAFKLDDGNRLMTAVVGEKEDTLTVHKWDGKRFNAEMVKAVQKPTDDLSLNPVAPSLFTYRLSKQNAASVFYGNSPFVYQNGELGKAFAVVSDGVKPHAPVGRAKEFIYSGTSPLEKGSSVALTLESSASSFEAYKKRGYQRLSSLNLPDRYAPPILYAQKGSQIVIASLEKSETWVSEKLDGEILDMKSSDPRDEGKETLLVLLKPKEGNPVLIAYRSE